MAPFNGARRQHLSNQTTHLIVTNLASSIVFAASAKHGHRFDTPSASNNPIALCVRLLLHAHLALPMALVPLRHRRFREGDRHVCLLVPLVSSVTVDASRPTMTRGKQPMASAKTRNGSMVYRRAPPDLNASVALTSTTKPSGSISGSPTITTP